MTMHSYIHHTLRRLAGLGLGCWLALSGMPMHAAQDARTVEPFVAVVVEGDLQVKVEKADRTEVQLTGSARAIESVQTLVHHRNGVPTLVIRRKSTGFSGSPQVQVSVKSPTLQSLALAGSGDLDARLHEQPRLELRLSGSGDLRVTGLRTTELDLQLSGSGDIHVQGTAEKLQVRLAGSGDVWLYELPAQQVNVQIAGSGDARVHAVQRLSAQVSGSGHVRYRGAVKDIAASVAGFGRVVRD